MSIVINHLTFAYTEGGKQLYITGGNVVAIAQGPLLHG